MLVSAKEAHFTSDLHLSHRNIIQYCDRPWKKEPESVIRERMRGCDGRELRQALLANCDVDAMDEALVSNWNEVVPSTGITFVLGDFCFGTPERAVSLLQRLKGRKVLVSGNHDKRNLKDARFRDAFEFTTPFLEIEVDEGTRGRHQMVVLCHYALKVWNKSHHSSYSLFGHSHGSLPDDPNSLSFDVGVDCHQYRPWTYQEVKDKMATKTWKSVDHHGAN